MAFRKLGHRSLTVAVRRRAGEVAGDKFASRHWYAGGVRIRQTLWRTLIAFCILAAVLVAILAYLATHYEPLIRDRLVAAIEQRYQSKVQIQTLHVNLLPRPVVTAEGIEVRWHGRTDVPPMVTLRGFTIRAGLRALLSKPIHIESVNLDGLKLTLPPKSDGVKTTQDKPAAASSAGELLVVDEVIANGAFLQILPKVEGKEPLEFDIAKLTMHSVGPGRPMEFRASLTNPKPPGLIESTGHFGPWQSDEPGDSPVDGHYTFTNADLSVFTGISGILSSTGDYSGKLNQIAVSGTTDIPDFRVSSSDHKVRLQTTFQATVDGTNGDTYLHPVDAKFLQTELICNGKVEHRPGTPGKFIELDVKTTKGRVDDLLDLAVKGRPIMAGGVSLSTSFLLPPGPGDLIGRLQLGGHFGIGGATFTSGTVEKDLSELSLRAQGKPQELSQADSESLQVTSDFRGNFTLGGGKLALTKLTFALPGAQVSLNGTYGLKSEAMDFNGFFRMQAKVSQAFTGWKSMLLRLADPLFAKHGVGTEVPIHIGGTRENPSFGVELFHKEIKLK